MFCPHCGKENSDNARFCEHCGGAVSGSPAVPAAKPHKKKSSRLSYILVSILFAAVFIVGKTVLAPALLGQKEAPKQEPSSTIPTVSFELPESVLSSQPQQEPAAEGTKDIYVTAPSSWGDVRIWAWSETEGDAFDAWPGELMQHLGNGEYYYAIPDWCDHVVINAWGGTEQTEDLEAYENTLYFEVLEEEGYIANIDAYWGESHSLGNGGYSAVLEITTPLQNCTSVNFTIASEGNSNTQVAGQWEIMVRTNGQWKKVQTFQYNGGEQDVLIVFPQPTSFDAITAYPTQQGNYSYQCAYMLWGAYCNP